MREEKEPYPYIGRVVALATPLVIAPLAGAISVALAKWGLDIPDENVAGAISQGAIFIGGLFVALLKGRKWMDGLQQYEADKRALEAGALGPLPGIPDDLGGNGVPAGGASGLPDEADGVEYDEELDIDLDDDDEAAGAPSAEDERYAPSRETPSPPSADDQA